jgi:hypothetical protein
MTDAAKETLYSVMERWGFPTLVAIACGWVLRQDVLLPLVSEHRQTLQQICETQREIVASMREQTRLLYALQPRATEDAP